MFVERQAQRSSMHSRHLNEQLVRVLRRLATMSGSRRGKVNTSLIATGLVISIY
jgi:ornithine--oxo-acid transaminase